MSGEPARELSWIVWPAGVGYKQFAIDVDEKRMFIVEMPADEARLLGDALSQADAAAEDRGYALAVSVFAAWLESEEVHALLLAHSRFRIQDCRCGWAELGKSHVAHVQAVLAAALTRQEGSTE